VIRRLAALFAALAILIPSAPPALAMDNLTNCALLENGNYHIVLWRESSDIGGTEFTGARGTATVRDLPTCHKTLPTDVVGFNAVLPANVQFTNGKIAQLGYYYEASEPTKAKFVYAFGSVDTIPFPGISPTVGTTYKFTITRGGSAGAYSTNFTITNLSTGQSWGLIKNGWLGTSDMTWWGYEQMNRKAWLGVPAGAARVNMTDIGYRTGASTWTYPDTYGMWIGNPGPNQSWTFYSRERCGVRTGSGSTQYFNVYTYDVGVNCTTG
jgi:hypothetical protein